LKAAMGKRQGFSAINKKYRKMAGTSPPFGTGRAARGLGGFEGQQIKSPPAPLYKGGGEAEDLNRLIQNPWLAAHHLEQISCARQTF